MAVIELSANLREVSHCPALCSSGDLAIVGAFNKEQAFSDTVKLREGSCTGLAGSPGPVV